MLVYVAYARQCAGLALHSHTVATCLKMPQPHLSRSNANIESAGHHKAILRNAPRNQAVVEAPCGLLIDNDYWPRFRAGNLECECLGPTCVGKERQGLQIQARCPSLLQISLEINENPIGNQSKFRKYQ